MTLGSPKTRRRTTKGIKMLEKSVWAYVDKNYGGKRFVVRIGSAFGDLSQQGIANKISSFLWR